MTELWHGMMDAWQEPATRHAIIVHWPIVLSLVGLALTAVVAVRPSNHTARWSAVIVFTLMAVVSRLAFTSGIGAEGAAGATITIAADEVLERHKSMGDDIQFFAAALAIALALTAFEKKWLRISAISLGMIGAAVTVGWVAVTAHHGGELVYRHAVGIHLRPGAAETPVAETGGGSGDPRLAFFEAEVRPILESKCWGCHNPARAHRSGDLNLTDMASILNGGETSPAISIGDPDGSLLIQAVRYEDPFLEMPPRKNGQLSDEEVAILEQWVRDGAVWRIEGLEKRVWDDADA